MSNIVWVSIVALCRFIAFQGFEFVLDNNVAQTGFECVDPFGGSCVDLLVGVYIVGLNKVHNFHYQPFLASFRFPDFPPTFSMLAVQKLIKSLAEAWKYGYLFLAFFFTSLQ